ncbi:MAG: histidine phosphatase superfamily [Lentinula lateritia]|uniref:Phosphoglycerate mutase-like protein n=1 Tax=Lentinula lateritia TaxID=40482 RepID=A0ABQ8VZJ7_9AGAR|nr:MAG: histidine phosphatase superfamily [Lentinula lateritia]KAJ4501759.1 phosphoglycerate mutase-like protein [Lentinula lateritia]
MLLLSAFVSAALARQISAAVVPSKASSFAGSTSTFQFPPADVTSTATLINSFFPDASEVGFAGPTPTGDEAESVATAPALSPVKGYFPLVRPDTSDKKGKDFNVVESWANLSPMQSVKSFGLDNATEMIPEGCKINQVFLLHRHGARYPTSGSSPSTFAADVHSAAGNGTFLATGPLEFLNTWTYKLGAELLTPFGREQLFNLGVGFRVKYGDLLKNFTGLPVWRTTSEARMVDSALHFAAGFFGVQSFQSSYHQVIEIEEEGFNSTLVPWDQCPNANNDIYTLGDDATKAWNNVYLVDAQKRFAQYLPGFNLTIDDVAGMQALCPYETVALGYSAFCDLFTEEEWKGFAYGIDLNFWYGDGPGNPAVSAQGIGWVQELVSRLTKTRITTFDSTLNGTIVGNNVTFPLDQPIYVDASHDTVISAVLPAMNFTFFAAGGPLPLDHIPENQTYKTREIAPFASRLVGQVLSCPASDTPTHIRWLLNDGVLPLTGIQGCGYDSNGLCEFDTFIAGMKQRIEEVDFVFDCFANYSLSLDNDTITNGQFPQ